MAQGTIRDYDEAEGTGTLLMDDRREVSIDRRSTEGTEVRTLRIGQRVRFDLSDEDGRAVARTLHVVTFE
jgi:cold shock CspA family protein